MRKLLPVVVAAASALLVTGNALAATKTVNIYGSTFQPARVTVDAGDTVRWVNKDNANHQIVADRGSFASPILRQGNSYSHTFKDAGSFGYRDVLGAVKRGTVVVRGAAASVTLGVAAPIVVYGTETSVGGAVSNGKSGETVTISAQPYGQASMQQVATVTTGANGVFSYTVRPERLTNYVASWKGAGSVQVTVQVRPKVSFLPLGRRMYAKVAGPSVPGHYVYLQRLSAFGQWVTIAKYKLGAMSGRIFTLPRKCGSARYRVYITVNQAGTGFLDGWSGTQHTSYKTRCSR